MSSLLQFTHELSSIGVGYDLHQGAPVPGKVWGSLSRLYQWINRMNTAELPAPFPHIDLAGFFTEIFQDESLSSLERDLNMIRAEFERTKDPRQQDHLKKMLRKALAELDRVLEV